MLKRIRLCSSLLIVPLVFIFEASGVEASTAEETLAKINRLPQAERHAALVKGAKNEKTIVWYAPMNREDLRQFTSGFEAEYPFLKVEVLTSGPQSLLNRILTEHRAGKYNYDTLNIRSSALYTLKKANAILRNDTPYRKGLRTGFYDKEGYFNGIWASLLVYLFNTKQDNSGGGAEINRRSPATQVEKESSEWTRMPTIGWRHCWIITAMRKANKSRAAWEDKT